MTEPEAGSTHWQAAAEHASAGAGTRHRLIHRLAMKLVGPFLHEQRLFNQDVLAVLVEQRDDLAAQASNAAVMARAATAATEALSAKIGELDGNLERRGWAIDAILPVLDQHGWAIENAKVDLEKLREEDVRLQREQDNLERSEFARLQDGLGLLRREINELTRSFDDRLEQLTAGELRELRSRADEIGQQLTDLQREIAAAREQNGQ